MLGTLDIHSRKLRAACWSVIVVMSVHVDLLRDTAQWPAQCSDKPSTYVLFAAGDVLASPTGGASLIPCGLQLRPRPGFAAFVCCSLWSVCLELQFRRSALLLTAVDLVENAGMRAVSCTSWLSCAAARCAVRLLGSLLLCWLFVPLLHL